MASSKLRALITILEDSPGALSIRELARELDLSPGRVENMMEYWVRKGKIRSTASPMDCGACSSLGNCPFILEMPRTYELVRENEGELLARMGPICK